MISKIAVHVNKRKLSQSKKNNFSSKKHPAYLLVVVFLLVSIFGSHFHYTIRNSGRYLLPIIKTLDSEFFKNDSVVDSLGKFKSLFYDILTLGFKAIRVSPDNLSSTLQALYVFSKMLLIILIFILAYQLMNNIWFFLLMAAWVSHIKPVPVGNILLFKPLLTHETVAFLLGLTALIFLLRRNYILFWLTLGFSIFIHSLMAFHIFLCFAPPLFLIEKYRSKRHILGLILLVIFSFLYLWLMAPSFLSSKEATILFIEKGTCEHVSPLNQSIFGWTEMLGFIILAYLADRQILKHNKNTKLIIRFILGGTFIGLFLSISAIISKLPIFTLLQPMRIFLWVTFLAIFLIAVAAAQSLRQNSQAGIILIGVLILSILYSPLSLVFVFVAIVYLIIEKHWAKLSQYIPFSFDTLASVIITLAICGMFFSWITQLWYPHSPSILAAVFLIFLMSLKIIRKKNWNRILIYALVGYTVLVTSIFHHDYFANNMDSDWDKTRLWCKKNTKKDDIFITPPDGNNFRILSLRSTVSEDMPALLWVDPFEYVKNYERVSRVEKGFSGMKWNLKYLFSLAQKWRADYVIIKGAFDPFNIYPIFSSGDFCVFKVQ